MSKATVSPASKHSQALGCGKNSNISTVLDKALGMSKQNTIVVNDALNKGKIPEGEAKPKK